MLSDAPPPAPRASLSARILGGIVSLLLGAVFGALGTVVHMVTISLADWEAPLGLVLALIALALLLLGLRLSFESRLYSVLGAVGALGVVALFVLPSQGGSILITGTGEGPVWLYGAVIVALVIVVWPRFRRTPVRSGRLDPSA
ncbi:DUF6113 family protein [Cnuibacter physcomitrellae]|uniref:DUF6113 family protein n=1 Tax=Cnuibacter physcomitrellae TaxID=1619308 RepID=UPI002175F995|nr:DUF6113 family protein [Cnuibacter physcomitrellae]MCS5496580.1 DUF6113 family protein [Cnuibacter physcomitrellae]